MRATPPLELWGGIECTVNRVGDQWFDQLAWSGHDVRASDLERFAAIGIRAVRYPLLWERLAPQRLDAIDWRWSDHRLGRIRDLGIRPIVGLVHHGSGPSYTSLLDPEFPDKLARFAAAVARRYPWIVDFTPINEPLTTARFSGLYGHWYPHARDDCSFVRALLNEMHGIVRAMDAIRQVTPDARLIQTEDCGRTSGTPAVRRQVAHERRRQWLTWDFLTGRVDDRHPLHPFLAGAGMSDADERQLHDARCPPDLVGLNYYLTSDRFLDDRLDRYPPHQHGGNGYMRYADIEAVRGRRAGIVGHEAHLVAAWKRYRIPVAITEVHLGCTREEQMRWLVESWRAAERARGRGADVRAVTAWALLGSHNWNSLVTRNSGHYEPGAFDVRAPVPRPTALAAVAGMLAAGGNAHHPALAGRPWWRQSQRRGDQGTSARTQAAESAPLLIIGSTGTLGRAFHRICERRGLLTQIVGRHELDISEPLAVDALLRRARPWAVVNAAGYVRVDAAERDPDACRRANVAGPVNLAAACRRHGIRLVTFSSDLVFDGRKAAPYIETDQPLPLNVYGATKAEAERRVLEMLPDALVVRTSAFFGPWDAHNFLTAAFRALDAGAWFRAPTDGAVSPTYVPDLVDASLDLLIDAERGIWHLSNEGVVSWFDFAREAASLSGRDADRIVPAAMTDVWQPAARPSFSALASSRGQLLRPLHAALAAFVDEVRLPQVAADTVA